MKPVEVSAAWDDGDWLVHVICQILLSYCRGPKSAAQYASSKHSLFTPRLRNPDGSQVENEIQLKLRGEVDLAPAEPFWPSSSRHRSFNSPDGGRFVVIDEVAGRRVHVPLLKMA